MCVGGGDNFDIEKQFGVQALVTGRKVLVSPKWKMGRVPRMYAEDIGHLGNIVKRYKEIENIMRKKEKKNQ